MNDQRDDFDRLLTERLGATESRIPGATPPGLVTGGHNELRWVVVGTAAVAALVVGVMLSQVLPSPEMADASPSAPSTLAPSLSPTPTEITSPSPSPSPVATPPPQATPLAPSGPFGVEWTPVPVPGSDVAIESVVRVEDRLIVAGRDGAEAAVWISRDAGGTWERAVIASTRQPAERTSFAEVVEVNGLLVGIGWWGATESDQFAWMTWRSADGGMTWSEHRHEEQSYAMRTATVHDGRIIGFGWTYAGTTPFDSFVAISPNGSDWSTHRPDALRWSQVDAIVSAGDRLVAVGLRWGETFANFPTAWISDDDGATWRTVSLGTFNSLPRGFATDIVARQNGSLVAVGASIGSDESIPTAWISTDGGDSWRAENMGARGEATDIAEIERGLIAIGQLDPHDPSPIAAYTSSEGILWATADRVTDLERWALVATGDGQIVLAGLSCPFDEPCPGVLVIGTARDD